MQTIIKEYPNETRQEQDWFSSSLLLINTKKKVDYMQYSLIFHQKQYLDGKSDRDHHRVWNMGWWAIGVQKLMDRFMILSIPIKTEGRKKREAKVRNIFLKLFIDELAWVMKENKIPAWTIHLKQGYG